MPEYSIDSIDDPRLEPYRNLKKTNLTRWEDHFIAEGIRLVERLLQSDFAVTSLLVSRQHRQRLPATVPEHVDIYVALPDLLNLIVGYRFHAGMLGCGRRKPPRPVDDWAPPRNQPALIVGCPHTADPDNLGSIIRVAAAFGADGLLVGSSSADPFSRRTLRISMGNAFFLPIQETTTFESDLVQLQTAHDFSVIASVLDPAAQPLAQAARPRRMILLLGNESEGLPESLIQHANLAIRIPMAERIDSLNVGVASGIMLHHFTQAARQL